jgi:hypothetical protein
VNSHSSDAYYPTNESDGESEFKPSLSDEVSNDGDGNAGKPDPESKPLPITRDYQLASPTSAQPHHGRGRHVSLSAAGRDCYRADALDDLNGR